MRLFFVLLTLATLSAQVSAAGLVEVPHPVLDEYKPEVRAMLAGALDRFELMESGSEGAQLGLAYGRLGVHYYAHSEQDAARACFVNAIALDPGNFRWPYFLAVHYTETGRFDQAVTTFERVLALKPDDVPAMTRLGLALLELNRNDEAEQRLRAALEADPDNAAALAGLARVAENRDDWGGAIGNYERALALQPEASQLHYRLGQAYRKTGDLDKARINLEQRGPRIASIPDPLLKFMNAHTRPAGFYVVLGNKALGEGEVEQASGLYNIAHAIDPTHAGALVGLARIAFVGGQLEPARAHVDAAIELQSDSWSALQLKGLIEEQAGDAASAVSFLERSLATKDYPQTRIFLADALMRAGRFAAAASHYAQVGGTDVAGAEVSYRAGLAYVAAGDCSSAEPQLLAAYEKDATLGKVMQALARIYATCLDASAQQLASAVRYAQVLYEGQPSLETSETLAMTLAATDRFDDAVDFQTQAIFEALKSGVLEQQPQLKLNMDRYREGAPAGFPWPAGHAVFSFQQEHSESNGDRGQ